MVLTAEPRLRPLAATVAAQLDAVRAGIDPGRLRRHVERLDEPRGRRHAGAAMARAESYVTGELESAGWRVRRRAFPIADTSLVGVNLVAGPANAAARANAAGPANAAARANAAGPANAAARANGVTAPALLVGAHLDTVPGSPGADDNASAIAALLELARILPVLGLDDRVRLVVFDEEETGLHGSRALADEMSSEPPAAVVVLECIGFYASASGTQRLPTGAAVLYPGQFRRLRRHGWRGDWTLLAYRRSSDRLARMFAECLAHQGGPRSVMLARDPIDLPVAGPLLRRYVPLIRHFARSDHKPFWDHGVPAIQVTDTANFRNPNYHRASDTPATLDYGRIADITAATAVTLANVARGTDVSRAG